MESDFFVFLFSFFRNKYFQEQFHLRPALIFNFYSLLYTCIESSYNLITSTSLYHPRLTPCFPSSQTNFTAHVPTCESTWRKQQFYQLLHSPRAQKHGFPRDIQQFHVLLEPLFDMRNPQNLHRAPQKNYRL